MAPVLQLLLLRSLGLLLLLSPGTQVTTTIQELYVKPTEDTSCPEPCHTLDEYVQNATQYFVSNTAFNFLPGTHNLSQPLNVSGVTNLALVASNGTVNITCPYSASLSFAEISNLTFEDLTLSMCGTLVISDMLNIGLLRVCMQPSANPAQSFDEHSDIMEATNLLGTSKIVGFSVISVDTAHRGNVTPQIKIQYTDPFNWTLGLLPLHNLLSIRDSFFNYSISEYDIFVECDQSTYAVNIHIQNLTATQLLSLFVFKFTIRGPANVSLVNLNLETGNSMLSITSNTSISSNSMYISNCHLSQTAVVFETSGQLTLKDSVLNQGNGSLLISGPCSDCLIGNVTFSDLQLQPVASFNQDQSTNSLVTLQDVDHVNITDCKFLNNKATFGGTWGAVVLLHDSNNTRFTNCEFIHNLGSSIAALESTFVLSGSNNFSNNTANQGGALAFYENSYVTLTNWSDTQIHNNFAVTTGGAIYVDRHLYELNPPCFFQLTSEQIHCDPPYNQTPAILFANLSFDNNTAGNGGNTVYGSSFDTCQLTLGNSVCYGWVLIGILFPPNSVSNFSVITSDPLRACLCEHGRPSCTTVFTNLTHYPGEPFHVSAVVVGDRFGTVKGLVYSQLLSSGETASLGQLECLQRVENLNCINLTCTIFSSSVDEVLVLTANTVAVQPYPSDDVVKTIENDISDYTHTGQIKSLLRSFPIYINISLLPCPVGFMLSGEPPHCACDTLLQDKHIPCNLTTQTVQRSGTVWVNASFHSYSSNGVIVNKYCPNNYCKSVTVEVNLEHPDIQCAFSHSGILCGGCQSGLSLALGSAQCLPCSNDYLALLIPFALAGFVLVFFIKLLNLTVADGALNGLIFYANIVRANQGAWIPTDDTNILTVFIAWLNLDLGIETCFFDGLDAYWKTWLQFVFPLYIWAIVVLIIILSHYFSTAAKIFGSNSVPVLATLFFHSYPKLLRTVISILQASTLHHSDGTTATVWSYDGNVPYLSPKHVPLFLVALAVILFLWLPYTGILSFTQCLYKMSNYRVARLLMKLKPFLDAYFGPLKDKHRYWVGLLLLVRGILFIVFAATSADLSEVDLLITLAVVLGLVTYLAHVGLVYRKYYLSLLENSYLLNLGLLAGSTLYVRSSGGSQSAVAYASLGIAFTQFVVTVAVHFIVLLKGTWLVRNLCERIKLRKLETVDRSEYEGLANDPVVNRVRGQELVMSYSTGDYREPVLKYLDSET